MLDRVKCGLSINWIVKMESTVKCLSNLFVYNSLDITSDIPNVLKNREINYVIKNRISGDISFG